MSAATFTCPGCGMISHNPHDAERRYCASCDVFWAADPECVPEDDRPDLIIAAQMVDELAPILHGKPSRSQSIALAHLLHVLVCGFHANTADDEGLETQAMRERMLEGHIQLVRQLVQAEVQERARQAKSGKR